MDIAGNFQNAFLSTLSLRRATAIGKWDKNDSCNFYPRSPCGERRFQFLLLRFRFFISIHALLAESDVLREPTTSRDNKFLSTLSLRRATYKTKHSTNPKNHFYPRSPCGERLMGPLIFSVQPHFYPRSPCGERQRANRLAHAPPEFLSTLSLRRATCLGLLGWLRVLISIHALLAESDEDANDSSNANLNFYPRSPCGERQ